jgi:N-sulfoglucosamine sulfohydrolase
VEDFVSFVDIAPTFLELAGIAWTDSRMAPSAGRSLTDIFRGESPKPVRDHVLIGKERTDIGRPHDWGYPTRGIVTRAFLYLENFEPSRWPAGNPETGYLDSDGGATKTFIIDAHRKNSAAAYWALCFGLRPSVEFYNLKDDPDCVANLGGRPQFAEEEASLRKQLYVELRAQGDPRVEGRGSIFDEYPHANKAHVGFYERFMKGEKLKTGWVNPSDFETNPPAKP